MIFLYDVIIRVSFKVSFPHLYVLEVSVAKLDEIVSRKTM